MKFEKKHLFGIYVGISIIVIGMLLFFGEQLMYFLLVLGMVIIIVPFMISFIEGQNLQREKEEKFLAFTRDLVENVRSGTPISKGIVNLKNRNYGSLSPHVSKLANQLVLGIPLSQAFSIFAKETKSKVISRAVGLISEAEKAGGRIETILESVAKSVNQIDILRKERKASIANLVTQGYIIFIIFIIIMLVLEFKILPLVSDLSSSEGLKVGTSKMDAGEFSFPLFVMILVQSIFAGLVIGKISEGSIRNGFRHSFTLVTITLLITTGAKALFLG
jgi:flagellar protein FlaJ